MSRFTLVLSVTVQELTSPKFGDDISEVYGIQIRLMTNSRKPQSEKLATGGGRGTTAVKPDNN
jgi:hypothetical protein